MNRQEVQVETVGQRRLTPRQQAARTIARLARTDADVRFVKLLAKSFSADQVLLIMRAKQKAEEGRE